MPQSVDSATTQRSFFLVLLPSDEAAAQLASRSILLKSIYAFWAQGDSYDVVHDQVKQQRHLWQHYVQDTPFVKPVFSHLTNQTLTR